MIVGATLGTLIGGFAFDRLSLFFANAQGGSILLLRPHLLIWFFIAGAIALPLSLLLWDPIIERLKGNPPPRFSFDYSFSSMPLPPCIRIGAIAIAGFFFVIALLNIPYHIRLTDSALLLCEPGDWTERELPFQSIEDVSLAHYYDSGTKYTRAGTSAARAVYVRYHRGKVWTPVNSILDAKPRVHYELARLVARHAGVDIQFPDLVVGQPSEEGQRIRLRRAIVSLVVFCLLFCGGLYAFARWKNQSQLH